MKKRIICILLLVFCLCMNASSFVYAQNTDVTNSLAYIVYEQDTKQIILQQNIQQQADASLLSRMMCALVVLESTINGQAVTTSDYVTPVSYSVSSDGKYKLYASKQYTVDALLKATILGNADNCARVLAHHINPRTDFFVSLMNQTAARIGMTQTFFTSPDGSEKSLQRTTAYDAALFYEYALKNTQFKRILTNEVTTLWDGMPLLNTCSVAFSLKEEFDSPLAGGVYTGTSQGKGSTLMMHITLPVPAGMDPETAAPIKLIVAFFSQGTEDATQYAHNLVTDVQTNYRKVCFFKANQEIDTRTVAGQSLKLIAGADLFCVAPYEVDAKSYVQNISFTFNVTEDRVMTQELEPPILQGQSLGTANLLLRDGSLQNVHVIAGNTLRTDNQAVNKLLAVYGEYQPLFIFIFLLLIVEAVILITKLIFHIQTKMKQ